MKINGEDVHAGFQYLYDTHNPNVSTDSIEYQRGYQQALEDAEMEVYKTEPDWWECVVLGCIYPDEPPDHGIETLYRHYGGAGELLYVGISKDFMSRQRAHSRTAPWWDQICHVSIKAFPSRTAVEEAELIAIRTENPIHNKAGR